MKNIELPRKILTGDGAIGKVDELVADIRLSGKGLTVADPMTRAVAGDRVRDILDSCIYLIREDAATEITKITRIIKDKKVDYLAGVGGGRIIDITKVAALKTNIPFLSIPTAASHDGIVSPQASVKVDGETSGSIKAHAPIGVIADTEIIRKAPARMTAAGCADAISNYTAVLDWKLAKEEKGEYYGDYAATLAMLSAELVMYNAERIKEDISTLVEALISSGVAIGIAGTSRPCSGAEHSFSHALDQTCPQHALHGEQCGVGSIMMAYLHDAEWEKIRDSLKKVGAPVDAKGLGIDPECVINALAMAHKIRNRYSILRDGLSEEEARELAQATGVID